MGCEWDALLRGCWVARGRRGSGTEVDECGGTDEGEHCCSGGGKFGGAEGGEWSRTNGGECADKDGGERMSTGGGDFSPAGGGECSGTGSGSAGISI
jgi:hypothetical protein